MRYFFFDIPLCILRPCDVIVKHVCKQNKYVMLVGRIPNNSVVEIDGNGTDVVISPKFQNDETTYDYEIEGIDICLPLTLYQLEIAPAKKQTIASTSSRFQ